MNCAIPRCVKSWELLRKRADDSSVYTLCGYFAALTRCVVQYPLANNHIAALTIVTLRETRRNVIAAYRDHTESRRYFCN